MCLRRRSVVFCSYILLTFIYLTTTAVVHLQSPDGVQSSGHPGSGSRRVEAIVASPSGPGEGQGQAAIAGHSRTDMT